MPLRSVEAATRDDAIAAAREQFGPSARVVGVRRVRSGGVLGFFATERYVAEVAAGRLTRPGGRPRRDAPVRTTTPAGLLLAAGLGRARRRAPGRPRPARNGAAAWAAEAAAHRARASAAASRSAARPRGPAVPAGRRPAASARRTTTGSASSPSLLAAKQAEADAARVRPRRVPARLGARGRADAGLPAPPRSTDEVVAPPAATRTAAVIPADVPDAPVPVHRRARADGGRRPGRPPGGRGGLVRPGATPRRRGAAGRSGPSSPKSQRRRRPRHAPGGGTGGRSGHRALLEHDPDDVEVPTWAAEPEVAAPSVSPREEAIAEVLRVRARPGPLRRGARRHPAQGARRRVAADAR